MRSISIVSVALLFALPSLWLTWLQLRTTLLLAAQTMINCRIAGVNKTFLLAQIKTGFIPMWALEQAQPINGVPLSAFEKARRELIQ